MTIFLYYNKSERIRITKDLVEVVSLDGTLREPTSLVDPVITIQIDQVTGYNYCYIPEFERGYFIQDIISIRTGLVELHCHVDVLSTYSSQLITLTAIVSRNENQYNEWLVDNRAVLGRLEENNTFINTNLFNRRMCGENGYNTVVTVTTSETINENYEVKPKQANEVTTPNNFIHFGSYVRMYSKYKRKYLFNCLPYGYRLDVEGLQWIIEKAAKDDKFASNILSIVSFPFSLRHAAIEQEENIKDLDKLFVGEYTYEKTLIGEDNATFYTISEATNRTFSLATIKISDVVTYNNRSKYTLFKPYSTFLIYLPYYGWVDIDNEFIYNHFDEDIKIDYCINDETGTCCAYIYVSPSNITIKSITFQLGIKNALTYSNYTDIQAQQANTIIGKTIGIVGGFLMAGASFATGNIPGFIASALSIPASINAMATEVDQERVSGGGSGGDDTFLNMFGDDRVIFKQVYRTVLKGANDNNYLTLNGAPLNLSVKLNTITGYTEISDIHLEGEGFKNATATELSELETALKRGAIF